MPSKQLGRIALIAILSLALASNASADGLNANSQHLLEGAVAAVAVIVVVSILVIHHYASSHTVTGCVGSPENGGLSLTSEKDHHIYLLSGDTTGVKSGERMTLHLKRIKVKGSSSPSWEMKTIGKDFGVCHS
jgi:hypothetical protein